MWSRTLSIQYIVEYNSSNKKKKAQVKGKGYIEFRKST